jgi:hypothetical protein
MIKELEKNSITPEIIGRIIEKINEVSVDDLKDIEESLERFDSYCEEPYKDKLSRRTFIMEYKDPDRGSVRVHCLVNERNLKKDFRTIFLKNYGASRPPLLEENDVRYDITSFQKKDSEYFDIVAPLPDYRLRIPITVGSEGKEKTIGKFSMDPSFKFPIQDSSSVAYDFNVEGTARERCIFSASCTTCQEVIDRYPERDYKIRKVACSDYDRSETDTPDCGGVKDAIGQVYRCAGSELCQGTCTPYCSSYTRTEDSDPNTNCRPSDCSNYYECEIAEGDIDSCYCPDNENICTNICLPYCSDAPPDKSEDANANTNCLALANPCGYYHDCREVSSCACSTGRACEGSCPSCWQGEWEDVGGCGDRGCNWDQKPQSREVIPSGCKGYASSRCDPRPLSECPCVPDVSCDDLGCDQTDSCGTYCGDCPP